MEGEYHIFEINLMFFKIGSPLVFVPFEDGERFLLMIHGGTQKTSVAFRHVMRHVYGQMYIHGCG